ncbi:2'-5' RNA ligase family protein [Synechococcus sp. CC9311]|uniref:2'-5' RNA ligase family protein n=1 Tax=Synechococcus sp. (strain CC9311) TaxID=64471 RepID=UPI001ED9821B|nr:2'-5' RNA ligase family protein [Synechococcus sp. CC9311]
MITSAQAVSYWLLPGREDQAALDQLSALACQAVGACTLPPHITLYSEPLDGEHDTSQKQVVDRLQQLADCRKPVQLWPSTIEATRIYTQSLVLRFNASARTELLPWFSQLRQRSASEFGYRLDPHLSLLYCKDTLERRQELAQRLPLPEGPLLFERISAVTHPLTISGPADIAAFITIHTCSLA